MYFLRPAPEPTPAPPPAPKDEPVAVSGHDFTEVGKTLAIVGACLPGPVPEGYSEKLIADHCKKVNTIQN